MKSRFFSAIISRRGFFVLCCALFAVLQIITFAQSGQPQLPHTDTVSITYDPKPILCPELGMCIRGPLEDGCMGNPCLWPLPTPPSSLIDPIREVPLIISEFRFRGPGGQSDEFVELYNINSSPYTVIADDESDGLALVASDGLTRFIIPAGTVIPGHGHYLAVNSVGYSLGGYPAGSGSAASGDAVYVLDIPDRGGIALFKTTNPAFFNEDYRVDAVGYSTAPALYREGAGFPASAAETSFNIQYSFYRELISGTPQDRNDNVADFRGVETNGTNTGAGQRLGAPGPENLSSPIATGSSRIQVTLLDPAVATDQPPNRVRDTTPNPENLSPFGTMSIRRTFKNISGVNITRLRFRIIDVTTYPPPSTATADLRAINSGGIVVTRSDGSNVFVGGTTLETPPTQFIGGGWNSTMSVDTVSASQPLAPGASINVQFLLGVQQTGTFRFFIIIEALP
ncbi:MAG TPA: hypothetical protein VF791_08950 [Pyrinomonadaceae bacterium]